MAALFLLVLPAHGEEAAEKASAEATGEKPAEEETDETKLLLKQLTIAMISEVIDERTVLVRDTAAKAAKKTIHLRLGNVGQPHKGSLNDADYAEKANVAKAALQKLVDKQMVWYKAAPDDLQPAASPGNEPDLVIADLWSIDGRHINTAVKKDGHGVHVEEYHSELGKDILTAAAEVEKKESYKKLEEALKESEDAKRAAAKEQKKAQEAEEANETEPIGLGGWAGLSLVGLLILGVVTNFGQGRVKKVSLNRKKGFFEQFWTKMKGA